MRDFTKLLKNKLKSKKYFQQKTRLGYLPVQQNQSNLDLSDLANHGLGGLLGSSGASPCLSPQRGSSRPDLGDRLGELDTRSASDDSSSTRITPQQHPEPKKAQNGTFADEHSLIAQYCQKLYNGDLITVVPDSPMQMLEEINREQTHELELMIRYSHDQLRAWPIYFAEWHHLNSFCRELENENATLQEEYQHLKASSSSSTSGTSGLSSGSNSHFTSALPGSSDADILNEAKMLREHKDKLESRMKILEEHNQQLCAQLGKLKHYLQDEVRIIKRHESQSHKYSSGFSSGLILLLYFSLTLD